MQPTTSPWPLASGDFTPFGYLRNPFAVARSWAEGEGGGLRSTRERPGFGWLYPWARSPAAGAALEIGCALGEQRWRSRADFAGLGLHSACHTSLRFSYDWRIAGTDVRALFLLADRDVLLCVAESHPTGRHPPLSLECWLRGWTRQGPAPSALSDAAVRLPGAAELPEHWLLLDERSAARARPIATGEATGFTVPLDGPDRVVVALGRGRRGREAARAALAHLDTLLAEREAEDAAFWSACPRLEGDWPSHWRNGWVYDLETTRLLLFPPGGVFQDVWPAWMVDWPRAVLAEGTLDAMRLSYAQPALAQRAVLSLFRDTPGANVPCIFQGGQPNMVARDGSACGTSPAWCLPFYNIWLIYLRTLDRAWLAELRPHLEAYLRWWLSERTDEHGWVVYKCTWESGEDASPRLDPDREGDHVITDLTRPVELQATMSQSARILALFCQELGDAASAAGWQRVAAAYRRRTQQLWDAAEGRFRDWDKRRQTFIAPSGRHDYWGSDPCRFSPLSLTPLLFDIATKEQRDRLRAEVALYHAPPTIEWPSWSWVVLEAATWAGFHDIAAPMAAGIIDRVYRLNDRRAWEPDGSPMPGVSPEYWPLEPATFIGSSAYGWGANTASMLLRQVVGFLESPTTAGCRFRLVPGILDVMTQRWDGAEMGGEPPCRRVPAPPRLLRVSNLNYRGRRLDLTYEPAGDGVAVTLELAEAARCQVAGSAGSYRSSTVAREHRFRLVAGQPAEVTIG